MSTLRRGGRALAGTARGEHARCLGIDPAPIDRNLTALAIGRLVTRLVGDHI